MYVFFICYLVIPSNSAHEELFVENKLNKAKAEVNPRVFFQFSVKIKHFLMQRKNAFIQNSLLDIFYRRKHTK